LFGLLLTLSMLAGSVTMAQPSGNADDQCTYAISSAQIFHYTPDLAPKDVPLTPEQQRERTEVVQIFFDREPTIGTAALVIPKPPGDAVVLHVRGATSDPEAPPPPEWSVELEEATQTSLADLKVLEGAERRPEYPREAIVIWPAPQGKVKLIAVASETLPASVAIATVKEAVDLDSDDRADLLVVEFCCGDRSRLDEGCEYLCGETWQKIRGAWVRCWWWQPA